MIPEAELWTHLTTLIVMCMVEFRWSARGKAYLLAAYSVRVREHDYIRQLELLFFFPVPESCRMKLNYLGAFSMVVLIVALHWVEGNKPGNALICCDSVSVLKSLRAFISSWQLNLFQICSARHVSSVWVPAHVSHKEGEQVSKTSSTKML